MTKGISALLNVREEWRRGARAAHAVGDHRLKTDHPIQEITSRSYETLVITTNQRTLYDKLDRIERLLSGLLDRDFRRHGA